MTYCVGLYLKDGLVMLSDSRTNAGVDNVSTFSKMHVVDKPDDRVMVILSSGNLAISQTVINLLREGLEVNGIKETLATVPSMFRAAQLVGAAIRSVYNSDGPALRDQGVGFDIGMLLGGQIKGRSMRLFQIYSAGNFIEATTDTPFLQIGEHKYGKPILDRVLSHTTDIEDGIKLVLISMDSTLRSNLSVGLPIDLLIYKRDEVKVAMKRRLTEDDPNFRLIRERWSASLRDAYRALPSLEWKD